MGSPASLDAAAAAAREHKSEREEMTKTSAAAICMEFSDDLDPPESEEPSL